MQAWSCQPFEENTLSSIVMWISWVKHPRVCKEWGCFFRHEVGGNIINTEQNLFLLSSQTSEYIHVPVTLDSINVKTVQCPNSLTKSFPVSITEKGVSTFVVGIEKNALIGRKVSWIAIMHLFMNFTWRLGYSVVLRVKRGEKIDICNQSVG